MELEVGTLYFSNYVLLPKVLQPIETEKLSSSEKRVPK